MSHTILAGVILLILRNRILISVNGSVPNSEFFGYGIAAGDSTVPKGDDNFVKVGLKNGHFFKFFNRSYTELFVNNNGGISFVDGVEEYTPKCGPMDVPMIVPFWADVNTNLGGNVYYRESTNDSDRIRATDRIRAAFSLKSNPSVNWLFIVTWDNVAFHGATANCSGLSRRNTFQAILASVGPANQPESYVEFLYHNLTWTTGAESKGNCRGLVGYPAKAGFDSGDKRTFYRLPGTCSPDILSIMNKTNVHENGKWIFRIDSDFEEPVAMETTEIEATNSTMSTKILSNKT